MTGKPSSVPSGQKLARKVEMMSETIAAVKSIELGGVDLQIVLINWFFHNYYEAASTQAFITAVHMKFPITIHFTEIPTFFHRKSLTCISCSDYS
jgi:hypothetical protein